MWYITWYIHPIAFSYELLKVMLHYLKVFSYVQSCQIKANKRPVYFAF